MSAEMYSIAANVATIVACGVAVVAVCISVCHFLASQKVAREKQAVDLFIKFNQLSIEQGQSSSSQSDHWYGNSKFAVTEFLYEISRKSPSWQETIKWMLEQQREFILSGDFSEQTYTENFRIFCKKCGYELKL